MARRRQHEEHVNHERWLVSYADFITLLFAFFVVMYSISSINEGKYKIISQALVGVFTDADRSLQPIPIGEPNSNPLRCASRVIAKCCWKGSCRSPKVKTHAPLS
jgi:Flagellar motor protein